MKSRWITAALTPRVRSDTCSSRHCTTIPEDASIEKNAVAVVTQTIVDRNDKAFQNPTKPIGSFMD